MVAPSLKNALTHALASERYDPLVKELLERAAKWFEADPRTLRERLPPEFVKELRHAVTRQVVIDRERFLAMLDRPPLRALVRNILLEQLVEFGKRIGSPISGVARGLGSIARRASERTGIGSLVSAVGGELERQLQARAQSFVDSALNSVFANLADAFCDPRRSAQASHLRGALLDGFLDQRGPELAAELRSESTLVMALALRSLAERLLAHPENVEQAQEFVREWIRAQEAALEPLGRYLEAELAGLFPP